MNRALLYTRRSDSTTSTYYVTSDHLGSADVITDGTGAAVVRESFAAYGARRGSNWSGSPSAADQAQFTATTRRGYTGHEMLDNLSLIHMNGRVYDPQIGRFISADPYIQAPLSQQSLNRYSYVQNGPMSATDPSGYLSFGDLFDPFDSVGRWVTATVFAWSTPMPSATMMSLIGSRYLNDRTDRFLQNNPDLQPFVSIIVTAVVSIYATPGIGAAVSAGLNAHFTRINGGSNSDILKAFVVSYATSYAFTAAGDIWKPAINPVLNTIAHAAIGCASAAAGGGNCGQGALSAGFGAAYSNSPLGRIGGVAGFLGATIAGGIGAELGGGDFGEGAKMAGMGYVFNHMMHRNPAYALARKALKDGYLTLDEANGIWRANTDPGFSLTVDAEKLWVSIDSDFGNGLLGGKVVGDSWFVHGSVNLKWNGRSLTIVSGMYNFEMHDPSRYSNVFKGYARNTATYLGFWNASRGGMSVGNDYMIKYSGSPHVR